MTELERRWDDAVETVWRAFRQRLADHVAVMSADDSRVVEVPQEHQSGAAPYCQVAGAAESVRVEAVSNVYLAVERELDEAQERALEREERGSVEPATMVRIYGNDTGLLLKAIRITGKRRREARTRAREAHVQGQRTREKVARARHDYLGDLTARMRAGLRLMVDAAVRKVQIDQLALFDEDEAGTALRPRSPDGRARSVMR